MLAHQFLSSLPGKNLNIMKKCDCDSVKKKITIIHLQCSNHYIMFQRFLHWVDVDWIYVYIYKLNEIFF